jgi:hypothetical protein
MSGRARIAVALCAATFTCLFAAARLSIGSARAAAAVKPGANRSSSTTQLSPGPQSQPEVPASAKSDAASGPVNALSAKFDPGREGNEDSYIFLCCGDQSFISDTNSVEWGRVKALRAKLDKDFIWIRHRGKPYLIRDEATVRQARVLWSNYEAQAAELREKIAANELVEQAKLNALSVSSSHAALPKRHNGLRMTSEWAQHDSLRLACFTYLRNATLAGKEILVGRDTLIIRHSNPIPNAGPDPITMPRPPHAPPQPPMPQPGPHYLLRSGSHLALAGEPVPTLV